MNLLGFPSSSVKLGPDLVVVVVLDVPTFASSVPNGGSEDVDDVSGPEESFLPVAKGRGRSGPAEKEVWVGTEETKSRESPGPGGKEVWVWTENRTGDLWSGVTPS